MPKVLSPKHTAAAAEKTKKTADHPTYTVMIEKAISTLNQKKGSSSQAILKYIVENYDVGQDHGRVKFYLKKSLKKSTAEGMLTQMSGTGATGSFKLAKEKAKPAPKVEEVHTEPTKSSATKKKVMKKKATAASASAVKSPTKKSAPSKPLKKVATAVKPDEKKSAASAKSPAKVTAPKEVKSPMPKKISAGKVPKKASKKASKGKGAPSKATAKKSAKKSRAQ